MTELTAGTAGSARTWRQVRAYVAGQLWPETRKLAAKVRAHRFTLAVPGLAGMALISASAGLRFGVWAGLGVAGIFCLRIDARL